MYIRFESTRAQRHKSLIFKCHVVILNHANKFCKLLSLKLISDEGNVKFRKIKKHARLVAAKFLPL